MAKRKKKTPSIEVGPYITEAVKRYLNKAIMQIENGKFGDVKDFDYAAETASVRIKATRSLGGRAPEKHEAEGVAGYEIEVSIDPEELFGKDRLGSTKQLLFVPYKYMGKSGKLRTAIGVPLKKMLVKLDKGKLDVIRDFLVKSTDPRLKEMSDNLRVNIKDQGSEKGAQIVFVPYKDPKQFSLIIEKINSMVERYKRFKKYRDFYLLDQGNIELIKLYNDSLSGDVSIVSVALTHDPKEQAEQRKRAQEVYDRQVKGRIRALRAELGKRDAVNIRVRLKDALEKSNEAFGESLLWQKGYKELKEKLDELFKKKNPKRKVRVIKRIRRRR